MRETNELIMVAENLGAIPPNTSYMLAIVGDKRYDAYLSSTEGSSAMIKFIKQFHKNAPLWQGILVLRSLNIYSLTIIILAPLLMKVPSSLYRYK